MESINEVIKEFCFDGDVIEVIPFGNGHINDTYRVICSQGSYVLQKINHKIFLDPRGLIENIEKVTNHIRKKVLIRGGNPSREVLNLIPTRHQEYIF
ncbi:hypothetical protein [Erysipelothrix rhusiopathiae]|uniref:Mucin-desulfating sulfatase n=2 Tax=Erysipelothrix rhusiopathiae TaxID=1648 RepID=E7FVF7_ERYRH|nr:hypothetical protein [Erysipelothrix rhusiopathiae]EFY08877.1 mucin-desulfating sulfatase [Erysipelothrix rhusiopathiae ATCC 19414]VEH83370.1 Uncharacterised protein [Erysipelothrix rhusiopathiae]